MRSRSYAQLLSVCVIAVLMVNVSRARAQEKTEAAETDLLAVTLINGDHANAGDVMERYDENEDSVLDAREMGKLKWLSDPKRFDLNRNDRLTPLEVAIYFANLRKQCRYVQLHIRALM